MTLRALSAALALLMAAAFPARAADDGVHHSAEVTLTPAENRIQVRDTIQLTGGGALAFYLREALEVSRLAVDGESQAVRRDGDQMIVELGAPGRHEVAIAYAGTLDVGRAGSGVGPSVRAEGSVLPPRSGWLPRGAAERITYALEVSVPAPQMAFATGERLRETRAHGTYTATFRAADPSNGPAVFAGDYVETTRGVDGTVLRTLFPEGKGELAQSYLDQTADYLGHYARTIGAYPYPAFTIVAAPFPVGLGFEGATYVSARILELPYMQGRSLAHEILHSWWGNAVAVDRGTGNWAEGLTTYQADHFVAARKSDEAAKTLRRDWLRDFAALPDSRRKPLTAFTGKLHDADQVTGYNKAALVFHMLKRRLGPETFRAGLARFYADHRFDRARWADIRAAFEAESGQELEDVFEQWLTRPGAPTLELVDAARSATEDGWTVEVALGQAAPAYDLRVPVEIATPRGPRTRTLALTGKDARETFPLTAEPTGVAVDPDYALFRALPGTQVPLVFRALTLDPETRVVAAGMAADPVRRFARRLMDTPAEQVAGEVADTGDAPLLVVGAADAVAAQLRKAGFGEVPAEVAGKGTLRAWTARADGRKALAVALDDPATLRRQSRALGYYLRASWLVVDGGRVTARGTWEVGDNPLTADFGG